MHAHKTIKRVSASPFLNWNFQPLHINTTHKRKRSAERSPERRETVLYLCTQHTTHSHKRLRGRQHTHTRRHDGRALCAAHKCAYPCSAHISPSNRCAPMWRRRRRRREPCARVVRAEREWFRCVCCVWRCCRRATTTTTTTTTSTTPTTTTDWPNGIGDSDSALARLTGRAH